MRRFLVLCQQATGCSNESTRWVPWMLAPLEAADIDDLVDGLNTSGTYRIYPLDSDRAVEEVRLDVTPRMEYDKTVNRREV